jgi:hypothetical protein
LRQHVVRFIDIVASKESEGAGVEKLMNSLRVEVEDVDGKKWWVSLLFEVIRSPGAAERLSDRYWELLVEFAVSDRWLELSGA